MGRYLNVPRAGRFSRFVQSVSLEMWPAAVHGGNLETVRKYMPYTRPSDDWHICAPQRTAEHGRHPIIAMKRAMMIIHTICMHTMRCLCGL